MIGRRGSFVRRAALAGVVLAGGAVVAAPAPGDREQHADVRASFRAPAAALRPFVRWWWPGADVTDEELRREVDAFADAHFGGVEIHPVPIGVAADAAGVAPAFIAHLPAAAAEARRRGLVAAFPLDARDRIDEVVVPSAFAATELHATYVTVEGPRSWIAPIDAHAALVAVVAAKGTAPAMASDPVGRASSAVLFPGRLDPRTSVVITERVRADGSIAWDVPAGQWQVLVFTRVPARGGARDPLSREASDARSRTLGDSARRASADLDAVWADAAPAPAGVAWTSSFPEDFRRLHGYDLRPYLPFLVRADDGSPLFDAWDVGDRIRHDYARAVGELRRESLEASTAWAAAARLRERLRAGETPLAAVSSAHADGAAVIVGDAFSSAGDPFDATPARMTREADRLFAAGFTQVVFHGAPYVRVVGDAPWFPFASDPTHGALIGQASTFWPYTSAVSDYVTRLQSVLQTGQPATDVALFRSEASGAIAPGSLAADLVDRFRVAGYAIDLIADEGIRSAHVAHGGLETTGGARYGAVIVADEPRLEAATVERIAAFRRQGLPVVFVGRKPANESGFNDWEARGQRIRDWLAPVTAVRDAAEAVAAVRGAMPPRIDRGDTSPDIFVTARHLDGLDAYLCWNASETSARQVDLALEHAGRAERWDPWTGAIAPEADARLAASRLRAQFTLSPGQSRLIVVDPQGVAVSGAPVETAPAAAEPAPRPMPVAGPWTLDVGGDTRVLPALVDWASDSRLAAFSGVASYSARFVVDASAFSQIRSNSEARSRTAHLRAFIDLGRVASVADVSVNSQHVATLLMPPYVADVSLPVRAGDNRLEVLVTNGLTNRLRALGLLLPPTAAGPVSSGLIGPVTLVIR